jgi:hypothetical protein
MTVLFTADLSVRVVTPIRATDLLPGFTAIPVTNTNETVVAICTGLVAADLSIRVVAAITAALNLAAFAAPVCDAVFPIFTTFVVVSAHN